MAMSEVRQFVYQPEGTLRRYVREILWVRSERPRVQILLPETTLTLVLRQSGLASLHNETLPNAIVSGLQQRTRMVEHAAGSSLVIVRFTEVGAPSILHDRADLLYNRTVPLDAVLPQQEIDRIQKSVPAKFSSSSSPWNASSPVGSNREIEPLRRASLLRLRQP
jgi:hypothetical protein